MWIYMFVKQKAGDGKLDRDKDGIPCEKLCGKNGENMPKQ